MSPSQYRSNPPHGGWQRPYATAHAATVACAAAIAPLATSAHESAVPAVCLSAGRGAAGARAALGSPRVSIDVLAKFVSRFDRIHPQISTLFRPLLDRYFRFW